MENKAMKRIGILLGILFPFWLQAQVEFKVHTSRKEITTDDRLRVDFKLNRMPEKFIPPLFKDFYLVMGPMQSSGQSVSIINGQVTKTEEYAYTYVLSPKRSGILEIGPAKAVVDGKTYQTEPLRIQVFKSSSSGNQSIQQTKPGNSINEVPSEDKDVLLRLELTQRNPYVGQAIGAVFKLYFKVGSRVADMAQPNISEFKGFWAETISDKFEDLGRDTLNGQVYHVYALRRMMLIPQHPGKLIITPQRFEVVLLKRVIREWGMIRYYDDVPKRYTLSTGRVTINVKPLPEKNRPVDFSGAVGTFDFLVDVEPQTVRTGQDVSLTVKVMGKGNLNMFELPKPVFPPQWENYDPEHQVRTKPTFSGYRGSVSDVYTAIPQAPGKYDLPPISFVYFDPYTETYKRITRRFPVVEVDGPAANVTSKSNVSPSGFQGLHGIARVARWKKTQTVPFELRPVFGRVMWAPFLLFLLMLLGYFVVRNRRIDPEKLLDERENRYIRKLLADARKHLNDKEQFYGMLEKALWSYFKNRLDLPANNLNRRAIMEKLGEKQVDRSLIEQLESLWNSIEMARYAPGSNQTRQSDWEQIKALLMQLDKKLKKR